VTGKYFQSKQKIGEKTKKRFVREVEKSLVKSFFFETNILKIIKIMIVKLLILIK